MEEEIHAEEAPAALMAIGALLGVGGAAQKGLGAAQKVLGALGIGGGPSRNTIASREAREWGHRAMRGDHTAVALLAKAQGSKYPAKRRVALEYLLHLASGYVPTYRINVGPKVATAAQKALTGLGIELPPWKGSTSGTVPTAESSNGNGEMEAESESAAPPAKKQRSCKYGERDLETGECPPKPCKYGERIDGECPPKPSKGRASRPKKAKPCKYGERDPETGYCPPKGPSGKLTKAQSRLLRRAETAGGNILARGARGALAAGAAGLKAAGVSAGAAVGTAVAVVGAALAGWLIGQAINDAASGLSKEELRLRAARDRRHAVAALREQLGRQPTLAEQSEITAGYNRALDYIEKGYGY